MDTSTLLKELQYPGGLDFYPVVFQILMVVTWTLHFVFVNLVIGGLSVSIYGFLKKDEMWQQISIVMTSITKVSVSLAIVLGVSPLLFTQTIYDPLWYTANNLSASWVVMFIPILIVGYYLLYIFYFKNKKNASKPVLLYAVVSLLLILMAGAIMHIFSYQELFPNKWVSWYTKNGTTMNTNGWQVYAFSIPRYLFMVLFSFLTTGIFMTVYSWYYRVRKDMDSEFLTYMAAKGIQIAKWFGVISTLDLILYLALQGVLSNPLMIGIVFIIALTTTFVFLVRGKSVQYALLTASLGFISVFAVSVMREAIRMMEVGKYGYSIYNYKVVLDFYGPIFFFGSVVVFLLFFLYALSMIFKAGRVQGVYDASKDDQGNSYWRLSFFFIITYVVVFIGTGIIVLGKNYI